MSEISETINAKREYRGCKIDGQLLLNKADISFVPRSKKDSIRIERSKILKLGHYKTTKTLNGLRILTHDGSVERFDDFSESDLDKIRRFTAKNYGFEVSEILRSYSGTNCGQIDFEGNSLLFKVQDKPAFEIPLHNISHTTHSRSEVVTEFHQNEDCLVSLVEMRFHVPNDPESEAAEAIYNTIMAKADVIKATSSAIVTFAEAYCLTPRGRFDLRIYNRFLQLRGKTVDYKIPYSTILRGYVLPNSENRGIFYVLNIDPPIKQGQTRYPFLVFQFDQDEHTDVELAFNDEIERKCVDGKLSRHMSGELFDILSRIISVLSGSKTVRPETFENSSRGRYIGCSYKANNGYLFPLERGFIFVHKPTIFFRYEDILHVCFDRSGSEEMRSFDFIIVTKQVSVPFVFGGMMKVDYENLYNFVTKKNVSVVSAESKQKSIGGVVSDNEVYEDSIGDLSSGLDSDDEDVNSQELEAKSSSEESDSMMLEDSSHYDDGSMRSQSQGRKSVQSSKKGSTARKRKKRDPTMPKKPMSAYMFWLNENRARIKRENPSFSSVTEIVKLAGKLWKELTNKTRWENMAFAAKEKYDDELRRWKANNGSKASKSFSGYYD